MKNMGKEIDRRAGWGEARQPPVFETVCGIICLSAIFLYGRK